jgi:phenylalanyl-tRNA synthetase beta chain
MSSIEVSKREIIRLIKKEVKSEYLINRIDMLGIPVEKVEDDKLTLEVFPNRPDFLSQYGLARALRSFIGSKKGLVEYKLNKSDYKVIVDFNLKGIRPYTACCVVKNINFNDDKIRDIIQFQEKLHVTLCRNRKKAAIGIYPLEKIKFPIHFKARDPNEIKFKPLDYSGDLNGLQILTELDIGKKYAHLLQDLKQFPIFIDSKGNILSMPPIINSDTVGKITQNTKDVFIEVSGFDIEFLKQVLNILVTTLAEMGGQIYSIEVTYSGKNEKMPDLTSKKMKIDINYINKLLGLTLKEQEIKILLEKMGFDYSKGIVSIPCYRYDVLHQFDLMEDIAIAYGYENFEPIMNSFYSISEESKKQKVKEKMIDLMIGLGFIEVSMPHLTNRVNMNEKMNSNVEFISLESSLNQDYSILRSWLIPGLTEIISTNKHNEYPQNIFEIGTVFGKKEETKIAGLIAHSKANFTEIKQIVESLLRTFNIKYEIKETDKEMCFVPGRIAKIIVNGKEVGYLGEIHPSVIQAWQIEQPLAAFEIDLDFLF